MSQTVVLEQTVAPTQTQTLTLKFNASPSTSNPQTPSVDPKTPNPPDSTSDPKPDEPTTVENEHASSTAIPIPNDLDPQVHAMVNEFIMQNASSDEEVRTNARNDLRSYIEREEVAIATLLVLAKYAFDAKNTDLLDIVCQRVADLIKDKSVEEVREIFNITNDFTPEEEQAVRDEHPWAFED